MTASRERAGIALAALGAAGLFVWGTWRYAVALSIGTPSTRGAPGTGESLASFLDPISAALFIAASILLSAGLWTARPREFNVLYVLPVAVAMFYAVLVAGQGLIRSSLFWFG